MADWNKDAEDSMLAELFAAAPIADDGFSDRVVRRLRRRLWTRRLCLGSAVVVGSAIAFGPIIDLGSLLVRTFAGAGSNLVDSVSTSLPSMPMTIAGGLLFIAAVCGLQLLED